jgi:DNA-binding transcriptional LysR family regulator
VDPVSWAISQLGVAENPPGSNDGPPQVRYALPGEPPLPWCGRFVRTAFAQAGTPLPGNKWLLPSVTEMQRALVAAGAWAPIEAVRATPELRPRRGDLVLLGENGTSDVGVRGHHVGIVESFDGGIIHSIDGNWGNLVARVKRVLGDAGLWGIGRWPPG